MYIQLLKERFERTKKPFICKVISN